MCIHTVCKFLCNIIIHIVGEHLTIKHTRGFGRAKKYKKETKRKVNDVIHNSLVIMLPIMGQCIGKEE